MDGPYSDCSVLLSFVCSVLFSLDSVYGQRMLCKSDCEFYKL